MTDFNCDCHPLPTLPEGLVDLRDTVVSNTARITDLEEQVAELHLAEYGKVVYTEEQLAAAIPHRGLIYVASSLTLTSTPVLQDNTTLEALQLNGVRVRLTFPHVHGTGRSVLRVFGKRVTIRGFEITTGHPLTDFSTRDIGIEILSSASVDVSGVDIVDNDIFNVACCVYRSGGPTALFLKGGKIRDNRFYSFCGFGTSSGTGGVLINWNTSNLLVENNWLSGRLPGQTHDVGGNGFWLGNNCDYLSLINNFVTQIDRHSYEVFNSVAGGNKDPLVRGNRTGITGTNTGWPGYPGAFGITVVGNGVIHILDNHVGQVNGLGYEMVTDDANTGRFIFTGNSFERVTNSVLSLGLGNALGVSLDSRASTVSISALVSGCSFGRVESLVGAKQFGIQILWGSKNVQIKNNTFNDSGTIMVFANSFGPQVFNGLEIVGNTFNWGDLFPITTGASVFLSYLNATAVLKNNTAFTKPGATNGVFQADGPCGVMTGGNSVPIINVTTITDVKGESNLIIHRA